MVCTEDDERIEYLETPVKSENDKKEYRVIRLPNGLTALLISDIYAKPYASRGQDSKKDEKKAICGLCVEVGCFNDPPEIPGMANFLKHMVSMGSEKYPQEDDFITFISKPGDYDASTYYEQTIFHFVIQEEHLLSALDRFAQFFIKPLLKRDCIMRERENIKSEFQFVPCEEMQLHSSFAETDPANKFIWDNFLTFSDNVDDDKLYEELHKFRNRHYSAHKMKITIQAKLSLGTLERCIMMCFANVPSNQLLPDDFKYDISFDTPGVQRIFTETSSRTSHMKLMQGDELEVRWTMPLPSDFYKSKPHEYIAWIIGYGGKGSLTSYLRKELIENYTNSCDKVQCACKTFFRYNSVYAVLKLTVMLSSEEQDLEKILDAIFSFINLLKKENSQKRTIYYDIYKIMEYNFRFINEERAYSVENVIHLCENMCFYPPRDYITADKLINIEYNSETIEKCLNYLVPETANINIFKKNSLKLNKVNSYIKWFQEEYPKIKEIPKEWIQRWKFIEPLPDFHLPLKNIFITSDFSLMPLPAKVTFSKYPVKIYSDRISEIWYRPASKICSKCYMNFQFVSFLGFQSEKHAVFMEMYCNILKLLLLEELYPATIAGFEYQINTNEKGITIKINGFNEKLPLLLMIIAKYIVDYPVLIRKFLFETCKEQQLNEDNSNNTFMEACEFVQDVELLILKLVHYIRIEMHTALSDANFKEFRRFVKSFTDHLYIQCLVQGNITQDDAIKTIRQFLEIINCGPLVTNMMHQMRIIQIPLGISYCKLKNINNVNATSIVTNYYQVGITSVELSVLIDLLVKIMNDKLYVWIFEERQLEVFSCDPNYVNGILGYSITINTNANKCITEDVDQKIETFLRLFNKILQNFSEKELDDVKEQLIISKQDEYNDDSDFKKEVDRNWSEIIKGEYIFDRFEREMLAIKDIKINELREWFAKHTVNGSNFRKLSIHIVGNDPKKSAIKKENTDSQNRKKEHFVLEYISDDQQETEDYHIVNIEAYKKNLYVYPLTV